MGVSFVALDVDVFLVKKQHASEHANAKQQVNDQRIHRRNRRGMEKDPLPQGSVLCLFLKCKLLELYL